MQGRQMTLVIDQPFAKDLGLVHSLALMPGYDYQPAWRLPFENNSIYTREIINAQVRLGKLFGEKIYATKLPYKAEALEALFYNFGIIITFVIGDRLLRLNRLAGQVPVADIVLPEVDFQFDTQCSMSDFSYNYAELDPVFNQWILNTLLPECKRTPVTTPKDASALRREGYRDPNKLRRFYKRVRAKIDNHELSAQKVGRYLLRRPGMAYDFLKTDLVEELFLTAASPGRDIPCDGRGFIAKLLQKKSSAFLWPQGRLSPVAPSLKPVPSDHVPKIERQSIREITNEIAAIFKELILRSGDPINLPPSSFNAIATLVEAMMPDVSIEWADFYCEEFVREFSRYKAKTFFCCNPYGGHIEGLRTFACRQLGIDVISTQHSAWGGYLADGALVSERLTFGCDDYITFGWSNKDENLSSWRRSAVSLPIPILSEYRRKKGKAVEQLPLKNRVLLCTGFIYRFPTIYNSFLRPDTISRWVEVIEDVIRKVTAADISITLMMYDSYVARVYRPAMDRWLKAGGNKITEFENHDFRARNLLLSERFDNEFDAIIWDMPAGGFSEALCLGKRTFSLWNKDLIKGLPEAKPCIDGLLKSGIWFPDGQELTKSLVKIRDQPAWYTTPEVQEPLKVFSDQFVNTAPDWDQSWLEFFKRLP